MAKLSEVAVGDLRDALDGASTAKAAKRLMIALAYKDGVPVDTLSERYAIPRSTVYYWLDRFEETSIDDAIRDEDRPGRPPALTRTERDRLRSNLNKSPRSFGFEAESWSAGILRDHIAKEFGVEYSDGHVRRLLRSIDVESPYL